MTDYGEAQVWAPGRTDPYAGAYVWAPDADFWAAAGSWASTAIEYTGRALGALVAVPMALHEALVTGALRVVPGGAWVLSARDAVRDALEPVSTPSDLAATTAPATIDTTLRTIGLFALVGVAVIATALVVRAVV